MSRTEEALPLPPSPDTDPGLPADQTARPKSDETAESGPGTFERLRERLAGTFGFQNDIPLRDRVEATLKSREAQNAFTPSERFMLLNILRFSESRVEDVMVPRADIVAIEQNESLGTLMSTFKQAGHSRLPVFAETLDDPRGMVHIKDFVAWMTKRANGRRSRNGGPQTGKTTTATADFALGNVNLSRTIASAKITRDVLYVPPSMRAVDLLVKMQTTRVHMAIVIDEYGGTDGLVSIEDLVEEIVGDIEDEHDIHEGPLIRADGENGFVADARAPIEELETLLGTPLVQDERDEDVDTLSGLVFALAGRIPVRGEIIAHPQGIEFEVLDSDPRRIKRLRVSLTESADFKTKLQASSDSVDPRD